MFTSIYRTASYRAKCRIASLDVAYMYKNPLKMYRGSDLTIQFQVCTDTGTPVDITGATFVFNAASTFDPAEAVLITKTSDDGITITAAETGEVEVVLAGTDTADLEPETLFFELIMTLNASTVGVTSGTLYLLRNLEADA